MQPARPPYGYPQQWPAASAQQQYQQPPQQLPPQAHFPPPGQPVPAASTAGTGHQTPYVLSGYAAPLKTAGVAGMPYVPGHAAPVSVPAALNGAAYAPSLTAPPPHHSPISTPPVAYAPSHAARPPALAVPSVHPPTIASVPQPAMDRLAGEMQNLMGAPAYTSSVPAGQPVGIIGQPLPIADLQKTTASPVQPVLDPAYFRLTLNKIPKTSAVLQKTKLPFGLTVTPYPKGHSSKSVPVVDGPIVRCRRCRSYLNPYVEMADQGSRWKCNLCFLENEFPANYDYDVATQKYVERTGKAELHCPVYEFIAPMEYMVRPPQPPVYLFLVDVSHKAVQSGLLATIARVLHDTLDQLPNSHARTKIGIVTFDSTIHFYHLAPQNDEPRMLVVSDLDDPFLPSIEDLLVGLTEARAQVERILKKASALFAGTQIAQSALGPALNAGIKLLAPIGGKIVVFQAAMPSVGSGLVASRDDQRVLGSAKENAVLQPANNFYKSLATECSRCQICIDMFLFPMPYVDVATIGCAARFTGGKIFLYPDFAASSVESVQKFAGELSSFLADEMGLEAVVRIRASQGVTFSVYHGSFFLRSTDLLALPNVNPRHSYTAQISIDENISSQIVCFQTAVLHTSCHGERRIRVVNAAFPVTDDPREVFAHADAGAIGDLLLKMASEKVLSNRLEDARDALTNKMCDILNAVKTVYQTGHNPQLLLPASLTLLPLLVLAVHKSAAVRGGNYTPPDYRSSMLALAKTLPTQDALSLLHPYLFGVHTMAGECGLPDPTTGKTVLPAALSLGSEVLERHGLYVLEDGRDVYIWVGSQIHPELCGLIFGRPFGELVAGKTTLPVLDNPWSRRLAAILGRVREMHASQPSVVLVRDDSETQLKFLFLLRLVEDKMPDGQMSYAAWAVMLRDRIYSAT